MADTEPQKPAKRRLKAPAQTVRQKAEQAQANSQKPKRRHLKAAAGASKKPFSKLKPLFDRQPFRFFGKVFHVIGLVLVPRFIRNAFHEVRLVEWPNFKTTVRLSYAVLAFAIVFGLAITGVDWVLDKIFKAILIN